MMFLPYVVFEFTKLKLRGESLDSDSQNDNKFEFNIPHVYYAIIWLTMYKFGDSIFLNFRERAHFMCMVRK